MKDSNAPKCPDTKHLKKLLDALPENLFSADVTKALEWLLAFLENRKLYHKKMQLKAKHLIALAKERGLDEEATKLANDEVFNIVANEEPDDDEKEVA